MENGTWWTAPTESESGGLILVTGRKDVENFALTRASISAWK